MDNFAYLNAEAERKQRKLLRAIEQGEKINNLTAAPEWAFFENFLKDSRKKLLKRMASTEFVNDHNGYLFVAASASTIENILSSIDGFKSAFDKAVADLNRIEEASDE